MAIEKRNPVFTVIRYVFLVLLTVITLLPLVWMLSASFKLDSEVFRHPHPLDPRDVPLRKLFEDLGDDPVRALHVQQRQADGHHHHHPADHLLVRGLRLHQVQIPRARHAVPVLCGHHRHSLADLHAAAVHHAAEGDLVDTHLGYILIQSFAAFGVFLLRQFYEGIPNELLEAARIDGLSEYGTYLRIVLPLAKPAMASLTIMTFTSIWNDFMGPMIYFNSESNKTIPLGIRLFLGQYSTHYELIMASSVVSLLRCSSCICSARNTLCRASPPAA